MYFPTKIFGIVLVCVSLASFAAADGLTLDTSALEQAADQLADEASGKADAAADACWASAPSGVKRNGQITLNDSTCSSQGVSWPLLASASSGVSAIGFGSFALCASLVLMA